MRKRKVAVLGSTGSIGRATLDVVRHLSGRFEVSLLAARGSTRLIAAQAHEFCPELVVMADRIAADATARLLGSSSRVAWGLDPLLDATSSVHTDIVVMAMSGTSGILPVISALEHGKQVCIATKEILVSFGIEVMRVCRRHGARLLPIDSELAGLHQCLCGQPAHSVRKVILTASGGPFRKSGPPAKATRRQVLRHPTWCMGRKITVDSATLMNKGLETIETARLFGLKPDQVQAVIHPQSIVHALVEFNDGSMLAQMSDPDMRLPIQYCLTFPERTSSLTRPLQLEKIHQLNFAPLEQERFPCYGLARQALEQGPIATCVLNAANQVAVEAFLAGRIAFGAIPGIISDTMRTFDCTTRNSSLRTLLSLEQKATEYAELLVTDRSGRH